MDCRSLIESELRGGFADKPVRWHDVILADKMTRSRQCRQVHLSGELSTAKCLVSELVCQRNVPDKTSNYRKRYILTLFKALGIVRCPYEIARTEWPDDSVAPQNSVDNMITVMICTVSSYRWIYCHLHKKFNKSHPRWPEHHQETEPSLCTPRTSWCCPSRVRWNLEKSLEWESVETSSSSYLHNLYRKKCIALITATDRDK